MLVSETHEEIKVSFLRKLTVRCFLTCSRSACLLSSSRRSCSISSYLLLCSRSCCFLSSRSRRCCCKVEIKIRCLKPQANGRWNLKATSSSRRLCSFCSSMRFCLSASSWRLCSSFCCCSSCWRRISSERSLLASWRRRKSLLRVDSPGMLMMELNVYMVKKNFYNYTDGWSPSWRSPYCKPQFLQLS